MRRGGNPGDGTPATADGKPLSFHRHRARALLRSAYSLARWRDPTPVKDSEKRAWQTHRRAVLHPPTRKAISEYRDRMAQHFDRHRERRLELEALTPYGKWAIPEYIVMCESNGSWSAYNPSGAVGPYQLLGKGAPFPVDSRSDKIAHHRIAGALWNGGAGASHWVCA